MPSFRYKVCLCYPQQRGAYTSHQFLMQRFCRLVRLFLRAHRSADVNIHPPGFPLPAQKHLYRCFPSFRVLPFYSFGDIHSFSFSVHDAFLNFLLAYFLFYPSEENITLVKAFALCTPAVNRARYAAKSMIKVSHEAVPLFHKQKQTAVSPDNPLTSCFSYRGRALRKLLAKPHVPFLLMQISVPGEIFDTHVITRLPTCRAAFRAPRITVAGQSRTHTGLPLVTLFLRVSFVNA